MEFLILFLVIALYFLPATVAGKRKHRNASAIMVLNLFLGWTFLGWILALMWAFTCNVEENHESGQGIDYHV